METRFKPTDNTSALHRDTLKTILDLACATYRPEQPRRISRRGIPHLRFRPLTDDTLPLVNSMLQEASSRTCDYSVGGLYMWVDCFGYEYCVYRDTLFIKGVSETDPTLTAFSLPIGQLPMDESVHLVREYCDYFGLNPVFSAVPEDRIGYLMSVIDGELEELDDWADYLYDARQLADLIGKKYNKKRNHVNRFLSDNPHFVFEPLTPGLLPEVLLFHTGMHTNSEADGRMADYERNQCTRVLNHFESYPFEGAVLRDETGEICAFTCGEVIGDTLYIHIEKMNHDIAGCGEAINKFFARYMTRRHPAIRFINREEDCGDPGLRHAKESYNPIMRLRKFNLHASRCS